MKVFKIHTETNYYAYSGKTQNEAVELFNEEQGEDIVSIEEIDQSTFNEKTIAIYEDNNTSKKPYKVSINDLIDKSYPLLLFSDDPSIID